MFSSNATLLPADQCSNSTGVSWTYLNAEVNGSTTTTVANTTGTGAASSATSKSAAVSTYGGMTWGVVGLVAGVFALGL